MFDWISFLDEHGIEYVTSGPNVARGNVNIHCPLCGADDPSHHLGISLLGYGWGCWRNKEDHKGSNVQLVRMLIGCSWERAKAIVGEFISLPSNVEESVTALLGDRAALTVPDDHVLHMPKEFRRLRAEPAARLYRGYLTARGYSDLQIDRMSRRYGIRYCTMGEFKGRIIFPVHYEERLVNWTGRTIYPNETLRYKTLTVDKDHATFRAVGNITNYLLWYDDLIADDCHTIAVVEGPFDALRVRVLGRSHGITSTCFFTSSPTSQQEGLLHELLPKYQNRILLLDRGTLTKAKKIRDEFGQFISQMGLEVMTLPETIKDPGELTKRKFMKLFLHQAG